MCSCLRFTQFFGCVVIAGFSLVSILISEETCMLGWDPKLFMWIFTGLFSFESILLLAESISCKKNNDDAVIIILILRYLNSCAIVGLSIYGNIKYYKNPDKSDC